MVRQKKGFGINTQQTLEAANFAADIATNKKNNIFLGSINVTLIGTEKIIPDIENPRRSLVKDIILSGLNIKDKDFTKKKSQIKDKNTLSELESIALLSESITKNGLLNPIIVYKDSDRYIIATGERRFLACLLLKLESIPSKILPKKPTELQLRQIQWAENYNREDLSVIDKLSNISQILKAANSDPFDISVRKLAELIQTTKTNAARYLSLLKEKKEGELYKALLHGQITSLKTAEYIASINDEAIKKTLISCAIQGSSLNNLKIRAKTLQKKEEADIEKENIKITVDASDLKNFIIKLGKLTDYSEKLTFINNSSLENKRKLPKIFKKVLNGVLAE